MLQNLYENERFLSQDNKLDNPWRFNQEELASQISIILKLNNDKLD